MAQTNTVRVARGGPKYQLVPVVFVLLVTVSGILGWLLATAGGS